MAHSALPRRDAPQDERWPPFEYHGEQWIADLEQSWLATFRNNLTDWLLSRDLPDNVPSGPRVASHRLSGSELYLHDLLEDVRVPWWRTFKGDLRDFWTSLRAPEPSGPGLDLSVASQHIRQLVPAMQRSLVHSIAIELRHLLTPQHLTPAERIAAKRPKYHPPLDIIGVIVAIAWHAVIIGVALAYSAIHPKAEAQIKLVKWPTTPIYFYPEPKPKEEVPVTVASTPALPLPKTSSLHQPLRRLEPARTIAAAPAAAAPVVAPPKVEDLNSMPALPTGLPATVGLPSAPVIASGKGGVPGGSGVGGAGVGSSRGSATGTGLPAASKPPDRIRISRVSPGSLLHDVKPIYPHAAMLAHLQGDVVLSAVIAKDGTVKEVSVIRGHPLLVQAAVDAVRQRRYHPPTLNGVPVEVETEVTVSFVFGN